jgi:hypothetical protein
VWKAEFVSAAANKAAIVRVLHARRGSVPEEMPLVDFMRSCDAYFANEGCIVDQPFQPRLRDGMIRCYMAAEKVVAFGHQLIKALTPPPPEGPDSQAAQPGPRIMNTVSAPAFQALRTKMESEWTQRMMHLLTSIHGSLPIIWDADFLYGPRDLSGEDTYVLGEINVSFALRAASAVRDRATRTGPVPIGKEGSPVAADTEGNRVVLTRILLNVIPVTYRFSRRHSSASTP